MSAVKYAEDGIKYIRTSNGKDAAAFLSQAQDYRLLLIIEGSLSYVLGDTAMHCEEGDVVFFARGTKCFASELKGESPKLCAVSFGEKVYSDIIGFFECASFVEEIKKNGIAAVRARGIQKNRLEHEVSALGDVNAEPNGGRLRLMTAKLVYDCFIKRSEVPSWIKAPPDWFVEYYLLLSRHYVFTKSFGEIIALAGKSREYVSRLFKSSTGRNISEYITDLRMNYACNLLKNSSMDVMEISFECGFENLSTFYHHFSRRMGMPPQSYRNTARIS